MKGYGLPTNIDFDNPDESLVETFGLKNGYSEEKRNARVKRAIRKSLKHSERFKAKQQIAYIIQEVDIDT